LIDCGAVGRELIEVGDAVGEKKAGARISVRFDVHVGEAGVYGVEEFGTPGRKVSVVVLDERVLHFLDGGSKGFDVVARPSETFLELVDLFPGERRLDGVRDGFEELDALNEELGDELRSNEESSDVWRTET
jgi:hypothetical protein